MAFGVDLIELPDVWFEGFVPMSFCAWDSLGKAAVTAGEGTEPKTPGFDSVSTPKKPEFEAADWLKFVSDMVVDWLVKGRLVIPVC